MDRLPHAKSSLVRGDHDQVWSTPRKCGANLAVRVRVAGAATNWRPPILRPGNGDGFANYPVADWRQKRQAVVLACRCHTGDKILRCIA